MQPTYLKHERVWLKDHQMFNERWLQDRIEEDPSILGLGELILIDRERRQERAGRLDLLLADLDSDRRFTVELMLGRTDESHIIRCLEYWDIERRRYPAYEHCAVLVAEDITSRFLNVLSLLSGTVPLVGIQLNALKVEDHLLLDFVRVLDQRMLRRDDEVEPKLVQTDRAYWNNRSTPKMVELVDSLLEIVNESSDPPLELNYNKYYIGLTDGVRGRAFLYFKPRKKFVKIYAQVQDADTWVEQIEEAGLSASIDSGDGKVTINVSGQDVKRYRDLIAAVISQTLEEHLS